MLDARSGREAIGKASQYGAAHIVALWKDFYDELLASPPSAKVVRGMCRSGARTGREAEPTVGLRSFAVVPALRRHRARSRFP